MHGPHAQLSTNATPADAPLSSQAAVLTHCPHSHACDSPGTPLLHQQRPEQNQHRQSSEKLSGFHRHTVTAVVSSSCRPCASATAISSWGCCRCDLPQSWVPGELDSGGVYTTQIAHVCDLFVEAAKHNRTTCNQQK